MVQARMGQASFGRHPLSLPGPLTPPRAPSPFPVTATVVNRVSIYYCRSPGPRCSGIPLGFPAQGPSPQLLLTPGSHTGLAPGPASSSLLLPLSTQTAQHAHPGALPPTSLPSPASFSQPDMVSRKDSGSRGPVSPCVCVCVRAHASVSC